MRRERGREVPLELLPSSHSSSLYDRLTILDTHKPTNVTSKKLWGKLCISQVGLQARDSYNQTPRSGKIFHFVKAHSLKKRNLIPLLGKNFTSHAKKHYCFKNLCLMPKNTVLT